MIRSNPPSSSSKPKDGGESDTENLEKVEVLEPHLSRSYSRSLVKELTSSRTKDSSNSLQGKLICKPQDGFSDKQEKSRQLKRRVKRRVQTRRPYQERLVNMAEARREIVSALKLHRETMKRRQQMKSGPEIQTFKPLSQQVSLGQEASNSSITCNNFFYSPYSWPAPAPPPLVQENLDFVLPRQTLGLNLNLQDFYNLDMGPSSIYSSSSASTSSSPACSFPCAEETPHTAVRPPAVVEAVEFEDQDQIEWNDSTLNLVSSPFDEVKGFPGWLNANESCLEHVDDLCFDNYYFRDYALPCMNIGEIEGVDGNWLA